MRPGRTPDPPSALARLFVGRRASRRVWHFSLSGGEVLYAAGAPADTLYFVRTGRLGVIRRPPGQPEEFLGVIKPGEPVGEMALIAGTPHSASVVALRDCDILALHRDHFFAEARRHPEVMAELARLMILRAREPRRSSGAGEPTVFGFAGVSPDLRIRQMVEQLAEKIADAGFSVVVVGGEAYLKTAEWFTNLELAHDFVLLIAEASEAAWRRICSRQADRLFLVGRGGRRPPMKPGSFAERAMQQLRLMDLVLVHQPGTERPCDTETWLDAAPADRVFHLREGDPAGLERLARVVSGTSVGLVLSGGGARAYAHIGVIRALREANVPIDLIGGASMGAIIGAGLAMGWDEAEIDWRVRKAFVDSNPLGDIAFPPLVAMTGGRRVKARLEEHFQDVQISDLWLPFFCVSSNLTAGVYHVHRRGPLARALRASSALPGLTPPVIEGDQVLVDGAVTHNMPTDVMRNWHRGPVIGSDVAYSRGLTAKDMERPKPLWRWFLTGEWRKGPPIVSLLIRTASIASDEDIAASRKASDVLIVPTMNGVELRDWKAYRAAVDAGYEAARAALEALDRPVTQLRRVDHRASELERQLEVTADEPE